MQLAPRRLTNADAARELSRASMAWVHSIAALSVFYATRPYALRSAHPGLDCGGARFEPLVQVCQHAACAVKSAGTGVDSGGGGGVTWALTSPPLPAPAEGARTKGRDCLEQRRQRGSGLQAGLELVLSATPGSSARRSQQHGAGEQWRWANRDTGSCTPAERVAAA